MSSTFDFTRVLGEVKTLRVEDVEEANRSLERPVDLLCHALFWFANTNQSQDTAMKNFEAGDIKNAIDGVSRPMTWSSVLDCHTLSLVMGDYTAAAGYFASLVTTHKQELLKGLGIEALSVTAEEMVKLYVDRLSRELPDNSIARAFKGAGPDASRIAHMVTDVISKKYVDKIESCITMYTVDSGQDAKGNLSTGQKLMESTRHLIALFKEVGYGTRQYELVADKLAKAVLQKAINYYNNTDDAESARNALPLVLFAKETAVGQIMKERCEHNYGIVKDVCDNLQQEEEIEEPGSRTFFKPREVLIVIAGILCLISLVVGLIWGAEGYIILLYSLGGLGGLSFLSGILSLTSPDRYHTFGAYCIVIGTVLGIGGIIGGSYIEDYRWALRFQEEEAIEEAALYQAFKSNPTEETFDNYFFKFPEGKHIEEVCTQFIDTIKSRGLLACGEFAESWPSTTQKYYLDKFIARQCDSLYSIAEKDNTQEGWESYQSAVPENQHRDSQKRIDAFEKKNWETESKAWSTAKKRGTLEAYKKYMEMYPKGSHATTADKKTIDLEVDTIMSGSHDNLPYIEPVYYTGASSSSIEIYNNTKYKLTMLYSGTDSKRVTIDPQAKKTVTLRNGSYHCAASVNAPDVKSLSGTLTLSGYIYSVEYYMKPSFPF